MKKINSTFFLLFSLLLQQANASTFYISSKSGDDSRTNTQAQNQSTPWKLSNKIRGLALGAGDQVLFERGGNFPGTIQLGQGVTVAGVAGNPVVIGAYGTGAVPILNGAELISTAWTKYQGNVWVTSRVDTVEQLFVNGNSLTLARYPNTGTIPITTVTQ